MLKRKKRVSEVYQNEAEWARKSILNVARMGWFSSDRSIAEYAENIWGVKPLPIQLLEAPEQV